MKKVILCFVVMLSIFIITGCNSPFSPILKGDSLIIVNGNSMAPTLNDGDKVLYRETNNLERFDIIVFEYQNNKIIKRIYGLPGETIEIKNGIIYINNKKIDGDKYSYGDITDISKITLANDEYFVLGDNLKISLDSRMIGPIKKNSINGKIKI